MIRHERIARLTARLRHAERSEAEAFRRLDAAVDSAAQRLTTSELVEVRLRAHALRTGIARFSRHPFSTKQP